LGVVGEVAGLAGYSLHGDKGMSTYTADQIANLVFLVAEIGAAVILLLGIYGTYIFYRYLRRQL